MTVKVATPLALVVADTGEIVDEPDPAVRVTVIPDGSVLPKASSRVTVMVDDAIPFASTFAGVATAVDTAADVMAGWKVTVAAFPIVTVWVESVAV